jgi:hypothetical protein
MANDEAFGSYAEEPGLLPEYLDRLLDYFVDLLPSKMSYATQYNTLGSCEKAVGANIALLSQ